MTAGNSTSLMGSVEMVVEIGLRSQAVRLLTIRKMEHEKPVATTRNQNSLTSREEEVEIKTMPWMVEFSKNSFTEADIPLATGDWLELK